VSEATVADQALLDAALHVLGERGVRGATTRAIAERAEVNEVTLFRRFGSKQHLILEACIRRSAALVAEAVAYTGDVEADLVRLAQQHHRALAEFGPAVRALLTELPYDPELSAAVEAAQFYFDRMTELLTRYQDEGVLAAEPRELMASAFFGPIVLPHLSPVLAVASPEAFDPARHVARFLHGRSADA